MMAAHENARNRHAGKILEKDQYAYGFDSRTGDCPGMTG